MEFASRSSEIGNLFSDSEEELDLSESEMSNPNDDLWNELSQRFPWSPNIEIEIEPSFPLLLRSE
jgi:hypothetical protein